MEVGRLAEDGGIPFGAFVSDVPSLVPDEMPVVLWTVDRDMRVTFAAGAGLGDVAGGDDLVSRSVTEYLGTDDPGSAPIAALHAAIADGRSTDYSFERKRHSWRVHVEPFRNPAGAVTGAIGTSMDLTELVGASRAAEETAEQLRTLSDERRDLALKLVLAQEEERERLSREIHDNLAQILTSIALFTRSLEGQDPDEMAAGIERLVSLADAALGAARDLTTALEPRPVEELGLGGAIAEFAHRIETLHGLDVAVGFSSSRVGLPLGAQTAAYQIVQEALANVVRHSGASTVSVRSQARGDRFEIAVRDDGKGFDPAAVPDGRLGLAGMRLRARAAGGDLTIDSEPGRGTTVRLGFSIAEPP